ncbi:unnamed protein product (macronuclear) [Paramecium tetraurelia]|uniref:MIR domain-containing protein n=1 Tax=Paramecium tetraurelia TaxID=5888 RepID=A0D205_PARTE|nr:uncharacterized protein GSPATT00012578001 [Paramecium tetraurelia]CAK77072.1 unnamed protein product [Paramecium tetraurelia]|eukprot:XP_001444469.1 hypothetical protein (macronuclear) [Paramecium tetraurelia strain d4-2]
MQQFDKDILVSEVVQIRNTKTGSYLAATGFNTQEKGFLFSSTTNINNYYVVGSDDPYNHYTLWTIVKVFDDTNRINYGDIVFLKNLSTKLYLIYEFEKLSEVSNQVRVSLNEKRQENFPLILQQQGEHIFSSKQYSIKNNMHLKIQTTKLTYFLQTSNKNYTSKQVKDYKEISCGKESDYNNWEIVKLNEERQQFFEIEPTQQLKINAQEIFDSDKIIIRNYKTGYSLHSHKKQYASTGMQEVTCFSYERDVNDWWVIQQTYQMASKQIQDQMPINLVHQETIKFLSVDEYNLAKSKNGNQVRATQASMQQSFIISTIDNQSLIIGKPFFLFYQPLNKYLCQGPSISEMQQTQYEAIMVDKITNSCLWVIEKKIK